jgi:hypothetical protein
VEWAYAQWETAKIALTHLIDVYQKVSELRKEMNTKKLKKYNISKKLPSVINDIAFSRLELSI